MALDLTGTTYNQQALDEAAKLEEDKKILELVAAARNRQSTVAATPENAPYIMPISEEQQQAEKERVIAALSKPKEIMMPVPELKGTPAASPTIETPVDTTVPVLPTTGNKGSNRPNTPVEQDELDLLLAGPTAQERQALADKQDKLLEIKSRMNMANAIAKGLGAITTGAMGLSGGTIVKPVDMGVNTPMTDAMISKGIEGVPELSKLEKAKILMAKKAQLDSEKRFNQEMGLKREMMNQEKSLFEMKLKEAREIAAKKPNTGLKALDKEMAAIYKDFDINNGYKTFKNNIERLKSVIPNIKDSGAIYALTPEQIKAAVFSKTADAETAAVGAMMPALRLTFGPQFTEAEGKRFFGTIFTPGQKPEVIRKNMQMLIDNLESTMQSKMAALKFYQDNGLSMEGYKSNLFDTNSDEFAQKLTMGSSVPFSKQSELDSLLGQ